MTRLQWLIRHRRLFLCGYLHAYTVDRRSHGFIMGTLRRVLSGSVPLVTGMIVDPDGYITNAPVVEGAQPFRAILAPPAAESPLELRPIHAGRILEARLLGTDKQSDLALLRIERCISLPLLCERRASPPERIGTRNRQPRRAPKYGHGGRGQLTCTAKRRRRQRKARLCHSSSNRQF